MKITLTDEQFESVKKDLIQELANGMKNKATSYIEHYAKSFSLSDYEIGEIRNIVKSQIRDEMKDKVMKNINLTKIEKEVERMVNQRVQSGLSKIMKKKIEVNVGAFLSIEE